MYCESCGNKIEKHHQFCTVCGKKTTPKNNGSSQRSEDVIVEESRYVMPQAKSKLAAGLLGVLIGSLGIHNFYLGYTGKGVAQLLLSTIGALIFIGPIIAWVWGLIEGIMILTGDINKDAQGNYLRD